MLFIELLVEHEFGPEKGRFKVGPGRHPAKEDVHPDWPSKDPILVLDIDPTTVGAPPKTQLYRTMEHVRTFMVPQGIATLKTVADPSNP